MKKMKNTNRKNVKWMAAAVLTASLLGVQIMPAAASEGSAVITTRMIMPENITIESPVPLSEISLPKSEYGKLSWADDTLIPSRRSEAFEVIFRPSESVDLSKVEGWDGESEKITGYVTVVVSSIYSEEDESEYEEWTEDQESEESDADADTGDEEQNTADAEEVAEDGKQDGEAEPGESQESGENFQEDTGSGNENLQETDENSENADENNSSIVPEEDQEVSEEDSEGESEKESGEDVGGDAGEGSEEESGETLEDDNQKTDVPKTDPEEEPADSRDENEEDTGSDVLEETEEPEEEIPDNIFDNIEVEVKDERPVTAEGNLTEEEMLQRAQENHSCNGIYVSGIHLPWYIQFRATNGESYEFSNESQANIFRSYEFELWDLKNDTEYEIPDGEYISVTIPVKEGYEYTIEHLLDNGAIETIIPSVDGSTMVFSTHSFSPFGIAGSKPLVGGEISDDVYVTPTPTTAAPKNPTKAPAGSNNSSGNNTNNNTNNTANSNTNSNHAGNTTGTAPDKDHPGYAVATAAPTQTVQNNSLSDSSSSGSEDSSAGQNADQASRNTSAAQAVKTGDNTQILPFVILVAAAVIIIGIVLILKRKKK